MTNVYQFAQAGFTVSSLNGLLLTGGSAFGLSASQGVVQWLHERKQGLDVGVTRIPIVPAACIYDLSHGKLAWPGAKDAYQACEVAEKEVAEAGPVGAGVGATVAKLVNEAQPAAGGFGFAEVKSSDGTIVQAFAVVNAAGEIIDEAGQVVAGATRKDGSTAKCSEELIAGRHLVSRFQSGISNTTLVAVVTNALMDKDALIRIGKMAAGGFAKAISPAFTSLDGDVVFAVSAGKHEANEVVVGTMAAKAVQQAIVKAV
jgi:L-aminopeptidase/D-esterase-like protein